MLSPAVGHLVFVRRKLSEMPSTRVRHVTRRSPTRLRVRFPDGTILHEQQASDTFALALQRFGLSRVEALDIYVRNLPLAGNVRSDSYASQTEIDGKYVCHHMENTRKKRIRKTSTNIVIAVGSG
jgi:hypothetical protein